jgi:DNA-binding transcriptional LysR family regulator
VLKDIADIKCTAGDEYPAPQWELVIGVPPVTSRTDVMPAIAEFLHAFPQSTCTCH